MANKTLPSDKFFGRTHYGHSFQYRSDLVFLKVKLVLVGDFHLLLTAAFWPAGKDSGFAGRVSTTVMELAEGPCFVGILNEPLAAHWDPPAAGTNVAGPSPAGHLRLDLNDPNLNSWCTCLISAHTRFNFQLMMFWLWALVNCQAELALKQTRSGRQGPGLSWLLSHPFIIYVIHIYKSHFK